MNLVDGLLAVLMVAAAWSGAKVGLAARALSWGGVIAGLALAGFVVPRVLGAWQGGDPVLRLVVGLSIVVLVTSILSGIGEVLGARLRHRVHATSFGVLDRIAGGVAGVLSIVLLVWFLLPTLATTRGVVAREVRQSTVVGWIDRGPAPPDAARALSRLIDRSGFPEVFATLRPAPITGPPPESIPVPQEVIAAATPSTFNVEAFGCGSGFEGSGFAIGDGVVVTNAHVVAGATEVRLVRPEGGRVDATVLHVDPARDLALLSSPGLDRPALPIRDAVVGEEAASIGYPGGQDTPRVAPAVVRDDVTTVGRDIYGSGLANRRVLYLSAQLRQGDSGSPVLGTDGAVVGVVFAVSPDDPNVAYALHVDEVRAVLATPPNQTAGRCQ